MKIGDRILIDAGSGSAGVVHIHRGPWYHDYADREAPATRPPPTSALALSNDGRSMWLVPVEDVTHG